MSLESILVGFLAAVATLPLVLFVFRRWRRPNAILIAAVWLATSGMMAWAAAVYQPARRAAEPIVDRPLKTPTDGYVSSDACKSCHPHEYDTWHRSYHRTMTQVATPETLRAPWIDGTEFVAQDRLYKLQQRGDEFWVEMDEEQYTGEGAPPRVWKRLALITGSHHFQFYHLASGSSRRMSIFPFCYRIADQERWMPLDGCCVGDPLNRQESGTGRWNRVCIKCHTTHGRPGIDSFDNMDSHVSDFGIACEACHGPGGEHVALNRDPRRRYDLHWGKTSRDDTIVNPLDLPHDLSSQVCAQCHGTTIFKNDEDLHAFRDRGYVYRPGDDLSDTRDWIFDGRDKFWSDGMLRVSGREFMGMRRSPCYERGDMTCMSCHVLHKPVDDPRSLDDWADDQLKLGMRGNEACYQCHAEYREKTTLTAHTHHAADSSGSNCYNCHMSYTAYGLLKGIRTHQISNPTAAESLEIGRPNACNQCHLDRTLLWAAEQLNEWYGQDIPEMSDDDRSIAASIVWTLKGDAGLRALMAWSMGWDEARAVSGTDWMTPYLALMMADAYIAVRYIANRSFQKQPGADRVTYDFIFPPEQLRKATFGIISDWRRANTTREPDPKLLLASDGKLDQTTFGRLLEQRDNTPLTLNE